MRLSGVGVWSAQLRYGDPGESAEAAAELEELGFQALWIPDVGGPVFDAVAHLLAATRQAVIATGILNLWMHTPSDVAASYTSLSAAHGDRFLLGIGVSHAPLIDATQPGRYRKPLAATRSFLDALDGAEHPVPVDRRVLAALGPKMLTLAAVRAAGAHPYLVPPDHTRGAREVLGQGPLLLPEQTVILTEDEDEARAIGTDSLRQYLALPNYANNLLRSGFSPDDLTSVSRRLFDAIIAWGGEDAIVRRVNEHRAAGADHVCIQVLTSDQTEFPREQWRRIAGAMSGTEFVGEKVAAITSYAVEVDPDCAGSPPHKFAI
jgi:probable F420-dependent oxidoreductase